MRKLPDGFVEWDGHTQKPPILGLVEILLRNGAMLKEYATNLSWEHQRDFNKGYSIVAYRPLEPQYDPKDVAFKDNDMPDAESYLKSALTTMQERGKTYDSDRGERSMGKTIAAFNAITGRELSEQDGWLLMLLLKQVRQWSTNQFHQDSALDSVAYAALLAESLANEK
jgi:hypothetical protein